MICFVHFFMRTVAKRGSVITVGITLLANSWIVVAVIILSVQFSVARGNDANLQKAREKSK